ncbi:MAG: molybdate ABC transporter permease subunit [Bacteroidetes bacterium]|jgi:molybdate transport system permease protein|nr:molybdate ABC transporter permease subunit [Bacteroidota bacterium]
MTPDEMSTIWLTLKVALISTFLTLPVSIGLAWILARRNIPGKPLIEAIISLPLVAPPVVTGYVLLLIFGRNGYIGNWLFDTWGIRFSFNFSALVLASMVVSLPLAVRTIRASFELIDPVYEQASQTLGIGKLRTFFRVSLPLAFPGVLSGMVLVFARSLGEFGATITLAGNIAGKTQTISLMIFSNMQIPGKEAEVMRLVVVSILISFLAIAASEFFIRKRKYLKT